MANWPQDPNYMGLNTPVGVEYDLIDLVVTGAIPAEVEGTFFRAVPDPAFPPMMADSGAVLSADGVISAVRFAGGNASIHRRYVGTARHLAEKAAGKALFGIYRNPFTDAPEVKSVDRTVANTTPVWHAGRLLMCKEDGLPYRVDPRTLETMGSYNFDGALKSETMTAHVRVDAATGELFAYGYEADGLASDTISYFIVGPDGALTTEHFIKTPYPATMHDFAITENYALFPIYPTTADLDRLKAGGAHWVHHQDLESWLGVMPRYGSPDQIRWFKGPKGVSCYHMMGAFEDSDGNIHFDQCISDSNAFPFIRADSGIDIPQPALNGRLERWTVHMEQTGEDVVATIVGPPGDFPVIPAAQQGRAYDHGWMLTMNPEMRGPPVMGGPVGAMFNTLLRLDFTGGATRALVLAPNQCFNEPVHVPSENGEGYLLTMVDTQHGPDDFTHECWIIDAGAPEQGAVAKVAIPHRLRPQIHGWWVSASAMAAAA